MIDTEIELIEKLDVIKGVKCPAEFPWPYENGSVKTAECIGVLEYVPGKLRGKFMDELYRVLVPEGTVTMRCLYWSHALAYHDFRVEWPPIADQSFLIFNRDWRKENNKEIDIGCNFALSNWAYYWEQETATKNTETQAFHVKHYLNAVTFMQVVLTKQP